MSSLTVRDRAEAEARELTYRAFHELGLFAGGIGRIHEAVASRAFGASGPGATPVRAVHDGVARAVYGGIAGGLRLTGLGVARAVRVTRPVSESRQGAFVLGVVNGLIGDELRETGSALEVPMTLHVDAMRPTGRVVIFLHGLMETEHAWALGERERYGDHLKRELDYTPVYVRYNTGRHISENGRELADRLERVLSQWPTEIETVALVGHSMGGLVARSACHCAALEEQDWVARVRHVVSLGTPHMGAPMAQGVHYLAHGLAKLPETLPVANFLRRRSAGIRDLRNGSLVDEDWRDLDPEALRAAACQEVPLLENATHCFISASITRSPKHPLGRLIGDLLVLQPSASGRSRTRRIPFEEEYGFHIGGASHIALLNHPQVYDKLKVWLRADARATARGTS
jgi:pimeloyl-ACP methyl ester carboxylesterase